MATSPGETRRYLINIYHDLVRKQRSNGGRRVPASEVGRKARTVQSRISPSRFRIPSDRQIQRILQAVKVPKTQPWSIGTLSGVNHEVLPFLMEMQEWCQSIGRTLTIDEARWGNRLFKLLDNLTSYTIDRKYNIVSVYALRESVTRSNSDDEPVVTTDLDAWFFTRPRYSINNPNLRWNWLYETSVFAGVVPHLTDEYPNSLEQINNALGWFSWGNPAVKLVAELGLVLPDGKNGAESTEVDRPADLIYRISDEFSRAKSKIFAYWLVYIEREGISWRKMNLYQKIHLGNYLIDWVNELGNVLESEDEKSSTYTSYVSGQARNVSDLSQHPGDYHPLEILNMAGIPKFVPETYHAGDSINYTSALTNIASNLLEHEDIDEKEDEDDDFWVYRQRDTNLT